MASYLGVFSSKCGYCQNDISKSFSHCLAFDNINDIKSNTVIYDAMLEQGMRRCGNLVYQPINELSCCTLQAIRVQTNIQNNNNNLEDDGLHFKASKSQRKAENRFLKAIPLVQIIQAIDMTEALIMEEFSIFKDYQKTTHNDQNCTLKSFKEFLVDSPVNTEHHLYRDGQNRLRAVGVLDCTARYLSSVYLFHNMFNTDEENETEPISNSNGSSSSPGTATAVLEAKYAAKSNARFYTLGLYSLSSPKLAYKTRFKPYQLFNKLEWN